MEMCIRDRRITAEKLAAVDKAEQLLWELGFKQFRVRVHGTLARVEPVSYTHLDIGLKAACFFNSVNDFLIVYIRTAGSNFQLSADNFKLQFIVLTILFAFYITIVLL